MLVYIAYFISKLRNKLLLAAGNVFLRRREVHLRSISQELLQPTITTIQNGLSDSTKPLPSMLTVRPNDIHLRSISQEILQPTITTIQNGLSDGTKPLPSMLTVRPNDIHLRSNSQEILQPTITTISFKIAHLNIQFNLPGANELKINILRKKNYQKIYFHKVTLASINTIDIMLLALSVKHHYMSGCT